MELIQTPLDLTRLQGRQNFELVAGQWLKIKVAEDFILQEKVPDRKKWTGDVLVLIDEVDE